jgi:preprotein translocase subunit YajC
MKLWIALFSSSLALAEAAPAAPQAQGVTPFIPLLLIFAVFYFLIIRPQQKKQKDQQQFLTGLKRGDMVITSSGIIGTVRTVSDKFVSLEIDNGVCIKMVKGQILESATSLKDDKEAARKEVTA